MPESWFPKRPSLEFLGVCFCGHTHRMGERRDKKRMGQGASHCAPASGFQLSFIGEVSMTKEPALCSTLNVQNCRWLCSLSGNSQFLRLSVGVSGPHPCVMMVSLQWVSCPLPNPDSEAAGCPTSIGQVTRG